MENSKKLFKALSAFNERNITNYIKLIDDIDEYKINPRKLLEEGIWELAGDWGDDAFIFFIMVIR